MAFFEHLREMLGFGHSSADSTGVENTRDAVWVYLQCEKCGEPIRVRLSKTSVLQPAEPGSDYHWFVNKTVVGSRSRCFNRMYLRLELDRNYRPVRKELTGGAFIDKSEFQRLVSSGTASSQ